MVNGKILQFPVRNASLFSPKINDEVLSTSGVNSVLAAAIRALPHIDDLQCREDLKRALCNLLLENDNGVA